MLKDGKLRNPGPYNRPTKPDILNVPGHLKRFRPPVWFFSTEYSGVECSIVVDNFFTM
jgi:hypothetical protein